MSSTYKIENDSLLTSGTYLTANSNFGTVSPSVFITDNTSGAPTMTVNGRVVVNERDLEERLDTIEKVLNIPERDVKLEKKYPRLKKLYDEYIKELSKARMWESLKGEE